MKVSAENFKPSKFLNWAEAIVMAPAEVNAATTGVDTKSTKKPKTQYIALCFNSCETTIYLNVKYHKLVQLLLQENKAGYRHWYYQLEIHWCRCMLKAKLMPLGQCWVQVLFQKLCRLFHHIRKNKDHAVKRCIDENKNSVNNTDEVEMITEIRINVRIHVNSK